MRPHSTAIAPTVCTRHGSGVGNNELSAARLARRNPLTPLTDAAPKERQAGFVTPVPILHLLQSELQILYGASWSKLGAMIVVAANQVNGLSKDKTPGWKDGRSPKPLQTRARRL